MPSGSADISSILDRILDAATDNLRIAKILVQMGLDPNNVTYDAIFNRLLEIFVQNIRWPICSPRSAPASSSPPS